MSRDFVKAVRSILEWIVLGALVFAFVELYHEYNSPEPIDRDRWQQRDGFIALSYGGLTGEGNENSLSREQFKEHMEALNKAGYECITTDDIINFYQAGTPLPEKALYLMFEGGRKNSAVFAHEYLVKYGFRATMFLQTAQLDGEERLFIHRNELKTLARNGFWDIGSQGHEFRRINAFGESSANDLRSFFLTDYLRNASLDVIETPEKFRLRIATDYERSFSPLRELTQKTPAAYVFMPGNMLWRSLAPQVEAVNREMLEKYYQVAFAREGSCFNGRGISPFNLTRMQISASWDIARILREIEIWSPNRNNYVYDKENLDRWEVQWGGLSEASEELVLSAPQNQSGFCWLKGSDNWDNVDADIVFGGDFAGTQSIYFRYTSPESFLRVSLYMNRLSVQERLPGKGLYTTARYYIQDKNARHFYLTLKGNRLSIRQGDVLFTRDPLPVANSLKHGKIALESVGESTPYDGRFGTLRLQPLDNQWRFVNTGDDLMRFANESMNTEYTALAISPVQSALSGSNFDAEANVRILFSARSSGMDIFGVLPQNSLNLDELGSLLPEMPLSVASKFWGGIVITPNLERNATALKVAIEEAQRRGLKTALKLDLQNALRLLEKDPGVKCDFYLLTFDDSSQPDLVASFCHVYDKNTILFMDNSGEQKFMAWSGRD